ncbi:MAG: ferritin family protein [Mucinivorans sp.]
MKNILMLACMAAAVAFTSCGKPEKTIENLKAAATGEANASAKYAAFSARAAADSLPKIAAMFAATSAAEAIHQANHIAELAKLGVTFTPIVETVAVDSTLANLYTAKNGEEYEFSTMYPEFIEVAQTEKADGALQVFDWAMKAENKHAGFYIAAIQSLEAGTKEDALPAEWLVCSKCGDTYVAGTEGSACELCATTVDKFNKFQ